MVVKIFDLSYDSNEESRGVLVMGEHSKALRQLFEDLWGIVALEHCVFEASEFVVVSRDIFEIRELLKVVSLSLWLQFLGKYLPLRESLTESEAWKLNLFELKASRELLECRSHYCFILNRVEGARRVRDLAANL